MIPLGSLFIAAAILPALSVSGCVTTPDAGATETETVSAYLARAEPDAGPDDVRSTFSDLNGDGTFEAILYLSGRAYCGSGGCTLLVLTPEAGRYRPITRMSVSRLPVRQLDSETHGWHDLGVTVGGGGMAASEAWMRFDGNVYPANPSTQPAVREGAAGVVLLAPQGLIGPSPQRTGAGHPAPPSRRSAFRKDR